MRNITSLSIAILYAITSFNQTIYVDASAVSGLNTGQAWEHAFTNLQTALQTANGGQEIWVAKGTYFPTSSTDRSIYFELKSGVRLLGGFQGNESNASERNWLINETVLSGDIGIPGDSTDNAYTILYAAYTDTTTTIDGFTLKNGYATNDSSIVSFISPKKNGGAIYLNGNGDYAALNILNCRILNNSATNDGGGIYLNGLNESTGVIIQNCLIRNNHATTGGGLYQFGGVISFFGNQIINCSFENNLSKDSQGGAISFDGIEGQVEYKIQHCTFFQNMAIEGYGGGAISYFNGLFFSHNDLIIEDCLFKENSSDGGGAAILYLSSFFGGESLLIDNSEFSENLNNAIISITNSGNLNPQLNIKNSLFKKNKGGVIHGFFTGITNCIFENNFNSAYSIGNYNDEQSPTIFNNCTFFTNDSTKNNIIFTNHDLIVNNSIFYNNFHSPDTIIQSTKSLTLNNCLFSFPSCDSAIIISHDTLLTCNNTIFNVDPLFRDTTMSDFSLLACSPAIDAGDNSAYDLLSTPFDFDGQDRIIHNTIDIGAYEAPIALSIDSILHVDCYGDSSGHVFPFFNGLQPFEYSWTNGSSVGDDIENLEAGIYSLIVTDTLGCSDSISFEITQSPLLTAAFITDSISCPNGIDGYAQSIPSGGLSPYMINWQSGEMGNEASLLTGGYNQVSITDAHACLLVDSVFIDQPAPFAVAGDITNASTSNTSDGSIQITEINGGTMPYNLLWSNGDTTDLIENLPHGDYILSITDANDCHFVIGFLVGFLDATHTFEKANIQLFPNPVYMEEQIYIKLPEEMQRDDIQVFLYDITGRQIELSLRLNQNTNELIIPVPGTAGLYIVSLRIAHQTFFSRLLVWK